MLLYLWSVEITGMLHHTLLFIMMTIFIFVCAHKHIRGQLSGAISVAHKHVRGQLSGAISVLSPRASQGLKSGHQAWWQCLYLLSISLGPTHRVSVVPGVGAMALCKRGKHSSTELQSNPLNV